MARNFYQNIKPFIVGEISSYHRLMKDGNSEKAFEHLERAHVLGQSSIRHHLKVHYLMLVWGINQRDIKEVSGQFFRLVGTLIFSPLGKLPIGNTGGSNVPPFKHMEIPEELKKIIEDASKE